RQAVIRQATLDTNIPLTDLEILSAFATTWGNGCMGISRPGQMCTMALVDGWVVTVNANGRELTYHTRGSFAILNQQTDPEWLRLEAERRQQEEWQQRWADIGWTQTNPVMPEVTEPGRWLFTNVPNRRWFDPPTAYGFRYTMMGDRLFTHVLDFPTGIDDDDLFTITVGDQILGEFSPGQSVSFLDLLGRGVNTFTISDINPLVDPEDPSAFPLKLAFDGESASFEMIALTKESQDIPEGSTPLSLMIFGLISGGYLLRSRL
ncbi:hypothetical protein K4A83_22045, partial [Spirulina subsalsa FACHB-351]